MTHLLYFLKQIHGYSGRILYINLFIMVAISLLEGIGILLLVPMLTMSGLIDLGTREIPIIESILGYLRYVPESWALPTILGFYVLIAIGQNLLNRSILVKNTIIHQGFLRHIRLETYQKLLYANWNFFIKNKKSDLINILKVEIIRVSNGVYSFLQFLASIVFTVIQICLAFILSPAITAFVLAFGLILITFNRRFLLRSLELGNRNFELGKEYMAGITEQINGIKDIKANSIEETRIEWFKSKTRRMQAEQIEYTKLKSTSQLHYKIASALLIASFIFISLTFFHAQAAQLMVIILIFSRLWPIVADIQSSLEQLASVIPAFKAVRALQEESEYAKEFERKQLQYTPPLIIKKGIFCKNLNFRYNRDLEGFVIKDINLSILPNQMTAFAGKSGAGKSTLIDLILGFNQPETGQVIIDDTPLTKENLVSLRKSISYVPQDPFLFNGSIKENLEIVTPGASEKEMWEALSFCSATEFVRKLPDKLDTVIGDRGIKLSGGERQRLVLARAILRRPSILILDEATSALDTENETAIQKALECLKGKMTIIVIAHRLSTIRNADQVIVLDKGKIVQQGSFVQLSQQKSSTFSNLLGEQTEVIS